MGTKMFGAKFIGVKSVIMGQPTEATLKFPDVVVTARSVIPGKSVNDVEYFANVNGKVVKITEDEYTGLVKKWKLVEFIQNKAEELGKIPEQTYFAAGEKLKLIGEILGYEE